MNEGYHSYYEALALYDTKLIGRSLRTAYQNGNAMEARRDICMATAFGGIVFAKGLCLGHAISRVLGAFHHLPHGRGCAIGLLCFVQANGKLCPKGSRDLAIALSETGNIGTSLLKLYNYMGVPTRLRDMGITEADLKEIAF
jgi:alcohol dehydrogenase class IV